MAVWKKLRNQLGNLAKKIDIFKLFRPIYIVLYRFCMLYWYRLESCAFLK